MTRKNLELNIITLLNGEPQFEKQVSTINEQTKLPKLHKVIENLSNIKAHRKTYEFVENGSPEDLFLKLDADMTLAESFVLEKIINYFTTIPTLDHLIIPVNDFLSNKTLIGAHCYSSRARWPQALDPIFVDPDPTIPGIRQTLVEIIPLIEHMSEPSIEQCIFYGYHRGLKIKQAGRKTRHNGRRNFHMKYKNAIEEEYLKNPCLLRLSALLGYQIAFANSRNSVHQKNLQKSSWKLIARKILDAPDYYDEIIRKTIKVD